MSDTSPFALTASKDVVHGFDYDVCVRCHNGQAAATSEVFTIRQENRCIPKYGTLGLIDIVRDVENHPEDVNKTANWFRYEVDYNGELNFTTVGFAEPNHTRVMQADANDTNPKYEHNETEKLFFTNS